MDYSDFIPVKNMITVLNYVFSNYIMIFGIKFDVVVC